MARLTTGLLLTTLIAGCGDGSPRVVGPSPPPTPPPPPSISSITPAIGSTAGGASMQIVGTGFRSGVVAVFDGLSVPLQFDSRDTTLMTMFLATPPHAAGTIDIVVTNPDGQSARYAAGHTYVSPETFDSNGAWNGDARDGSHREVSFLIQSGKLVRAYCHVPTPFTELPLAEPISVVGGAFSVSGTPLDAPSGSRDAVEIMSGRIVSATEMVGTMNFKECKDMMWWAGRARTTSDQR